MGNIETIVSLLLRRPCSICPVGHLISDSPWASEAQPYQRSWHHRVYKGIVDQATKEGHAPSQEGIPQSLRGLVILVVETKKFHAGSACCYLIL